MNWQGVLALFLMIPALVAAGLPVQAPDSVVFLTKNTNRNQVHYGVKLDDDCMPAERKPVYAYWRMLEEGPDDRAKLMFWEQPGYGVKQETASEGQLTFIIRGVPEREIRLETFATSDGCGARAFVNTPNS